MWEMVGERGGGGGPAKNADLESPVTHLRHPPLNTLAVILDGAGLAVQAVGGIDLQISLSVLIFQPLVDTSWAVSTFWSCERLEILLDRESDRDAVTKSCITWRR